jgi:hypothetical protein
VLLLASPSNAPFGVLGNSLLGLFASEFLHVSYLSPHVLSIPARFSFLTDARPSLSLYRPVLATTLDAIEDIWSSV